MHSKNIEEIVANAEKEGSLENVSITVVKLYELNNQKGLDLVIQLGLSDFGGITYKIDFQNTALLGVLHWGVDGLRTLAKRATENGGYRALNNVTRLLSHISSKDLGNFLFSRFNLESITRLDLTNEKYKSTEWTKTAKELLIEVVKSIEKDDVFPISIVQHLSYPVNNTAQEHVFAALLARWFNFNVNGLNNYKDLVYATSHGEIDYQNFLKANPYILEPFHAQIWSKPKFGEDLIPDFVIRSMDNSYTIVEIEQPDFQILTKAGESSAKTTHAKRQAMDFRDWVVNNNLYAVKRFNGIYRPFCLVVIGRESELDEMQVARLKQENESTQGVLRIVGFDWLYNRAKATLDNLINYGFERDTFNETIEG